MKVKPSISEFSIAAQKLSRNPLGIIALFIVLVYGIAALVLGISSSNLQPDERLPLIYFLVFFPVIVLIVFYRLVSHHHVKLYAPLDFPDKEGFFRVLSPLEQKQKLEEEIRNIEEEAKVEEAQQPESVKDKILSVEMEGAGILRTISTRHAYVLAEELAYREIESEFGVSVHRQVAIGHDYGVDGIFLKKGKPVAIEIKYTRRPQHARMIIRRELDRFSNIAQSMKPEPSFLFILVTEGFSDKQRILEKERLMKMIEDSKLSIQIRIFDFDELKEKYGIIESDTQQAH